MSNEFYEMVLGPSLTYSCAVWHDDTPTLEDAQANKHELVCRKLDLHPGMRLLDIGCGWGSMLLHAAEHHGVQAVGVTLSRPQAELARKRVAERGLTDLVEVRFADFRDVDDGPYDAISSIGMFEHVGLSELDAYFARCRALLRPEGRLLNHGISRPQHSPKMHHRRWAPSLSGPFAGRSFTERYVFPDGELHEIGSVVSAIQRAGFEARHMESLREHYALHAALLGAQPGGALGRRGRRGRDPAGHASGASTWRPRRWASSRTTTRCTRCSRRPPPAARAACRCGPNSPDRPSR